MNRITKVGKVTIYNNEYLKKEERNLSEFYKYLNDRNFNNYIELRKYEDNKSIYEYKEDISINNNQKSIDLIETVSNLHNKTSYFKEVPLETKTKIYNDTRGYIKYLKDLYNERLINLEEKNNISPSELIFMEHFSKLNNCLSFCDKSIKDWYTKTKSETVERVSIIHNKLELSHLIRNTTNYLISWDNSTIDTPIKDLIKYYKKEWNNINFKETFDTYFKETNITDTEKLLLFTYIAIPFELKISNDELENIEKTKEFFNYIYKTEELIRPYYSVQTEEKQ